MSEGIRTVLYPVKDLARAKAVFGVLLAAKPVADEAYYVGYQVGDQHIGLVPNGHENGMTGPVGYWHVDDIQATLQALQGNGATVQQEAKNVGGGRQVAVALDPDGNPIGLIQDPR